MPRRVIILSLLVTLASPQGAHAVDYTVTNNAGSTAGGARFMNEFGVYCSKHTLDSATNFIWGLFQEGPCLCGKCDCKASSLVVEPERSIAAAADVVLAIAVAAGGTGWL